MKKIVAVLISVLFFTFIPSVFRNGVKAQSPSTAKPITGTFFMFDVTEPNTTTEQLTQYFDDMQKLGIDTVVDLAVGTLECNGTEWNYFDNGSVERFLNVAHSKNMKVYIGVAAGNTQCLGDDFANKLTQKSLEYAEKIYNLNQTNNWGDWNSPDHFIQGFYTPHEMAVEWYLGSDFHAIKSYTAALKQRFPTKKILSSPYKFADFTDPDGGYHDDSADEVYAAMKRWIKELNVDVYAPQDSVGTTKTKSFSRNRDHFLAMQRAIQDGNSENGKNVRLWANIESFSCTPDVSCAPGSRLIPAPFDRLSWQIRGVNDIVEKSITWIMASSMYDNSSYYPDDFAARMSLRATYLTTPIIVTFFEWAPSNQFIMKGYNFGSAGQSATFYIHYETNTGEQKQFSKQVVVGASTGSLSQIAISTTEMPNADLTKPHIAAIKNSGNKHAYYVSQNPDTAPTPNFPEIDDQEVLRDPDLNNDGVVNIFDYNAFLSPFNEKNVSVADINNDGSVTIEDLNALLRAFTL